MPKVLIIAYDRCYIAITVSVDDSDFRVCVYELKWTGTLTYFSRRFRAVLPPNCNERLFAAIDTQSLRGMLTYILFNNKSYGVNIIFFASLLLTFCTCNNLNLLRVAIQPTESRYMKMQRIINNIFESSHTHIHIV